MGTYDIFVYNCPNCGEETNSQTKLGECSMHTLSVGCEFPHDGKILMKNTCGRCNKKNMVVVEDGIIQRFDKGEEATFEEGYWGSIEKIKEKEMK